MRRDLAVAALVLLAGVLLAIVVAESGWGVPPVPDLTDAVLDTARLCDPLVLQGVDTL